MINKPYSSVDIVIPCHVAWCDDKDMIWDVKLFYGVIRGLTRNDFYCCYASNERLAEQLGKKPRSIRRFLEILEQRDFIYRTNTYIIDKYDELTYVRAIVPTDLKKQFEKKKAEMLDLRTVSKKCALGGKEFPPLGGKELPPNILNKKPCKNNKTITSNEVGNNPPTPLQGGEQSATLVETEQYETLGKFGNIRLTKSQRTAFSEEFGADMTSALIEQLDSYIQSGVKRLRKKVNHYAMLRDWALRRQERQTENSSAKVLIGGRDLERHAYGEDELNGLFTPLDEYDADDG